MPKRFKMWPKLIVMPPVWEAWLPILCLVVVSVAAGISAMAFLDHGAWGGSTTANLIVGAGILLLWGNYAVLTCCDFSRSVLIIYLDLFILLVAFVFAFDLKYEVIFENLPALLGLTLRNGFLQGAALTLFVCVASIIAATLLALLAALGKLSRRPTLYAVATFYISFFRGTPLMLQVMLIFLGLPQLGIVLSAVPAGIIALSLCYGAYMAEILRAGIEAVPRGQTEGARSLGLSRPQILWLIVIPQATRLVIPPIGSQFIAMLKDSSLVSILGAWELMYIAKAYGRAEFRNMEMLIAAAAIYWVLSAIMEFGQSRLEKTFSQGALMTR